VPLVYRTGVYLVVFRNRKRADIDRAAYEADLAAMLGAVHAMPGFLWSKAYAAPDGEAVNIIAWESEAHSRAWGRHAEHARVQAKGRDAYYAEYELLGADITLHHHFEAEL